MKQLKFRESLSTLVLNGTKNSTWRLFDDKNIQEGDELELIIWESGKTFARAKVGKVIEKPLGKLTQTDKKGHETFASDNEMYTTYEGYYNKTVGPDTLIKIIWFELSV